ncbi:MAG TPA: helix-turn-helix transcriptional regulator, partial [Nocardioides sp.]|nr:helix-turn-helix transcriptional regulator [Nocardioides sp.]
ADTDQQRTAVENALDEQQAIWMGALGLDDGGGPAAADDPARRKELRIRRAGALLLTDGPRAAVAEATGLLTEPDDRIRTWAAIVLGCSLARVGQCEQALDVAVAGHASHRSLEWLTGWERWWHDFNRTEALLQAGRLIDAHTLALDNYELALASQAVERQALFGWQLTKINYERGRLTTAARQGKVCTSLFRALGRTAYIRVAQVSAALALARSGHAAEAAKTIAEVERSELRIPAIAAVDLWRAKAWCAASTGTIADGRHHLAEAIAIGAGTGDVMGESAALHDLARLGGDAADRLAELRSSADSALLAARDMHADATRAGDPEALAQAAQRFNTIGAQLTAAEAAADSAVRWKRAGDVRRAAAAEQRAHTLLADCEGVQAFGVDNLGARSVLSPGEHETAAIAATGKSNREIARQLNLSQRTVENRLQRVYDKLGVRGRDDLPEALGLTPAGPD